MKKVTLLVLSLVSILSMTSIASGGTIEIPCKSTIDQWETSISAVRPTTKTCQTTVVKESSKGACVKDRTWRCSNQITGAIESCSECVLWKTVSWKKSATVDCGGRLLFSGSQTCTSSNSTAEKHEQAHNQYDASIGSLFVEFFAQQGFKVSTVKDYSNGARFYFER